MPILDQTEIAPEIKNTDPANNSSKSTSRNDKNDSSRNMPGWFTAAVITICSAPIILTLLGFEFSSESHQFDMDSIHTISHSELSDIAHYVLAGSFVHTILEWSAFCAAIFTVILSFVHYRIKGDITMPIIGLSLLFAGCMDAFHTFAADRLIQGIADKDNLIPFTWAVCRMFNALILICGVSIFLIWGKKLEKPGFPLIAGISVIFGVIAYSIIHYCAITSNLPKTMYPDSLVTRPWDIAPMLLYLFGGITVFRWFNQRHPGIFAQSLLISLFPEIATQAHMAFGSISLFDSHFNIAHFTKIIAYVVPFAGLIIDYVRVYRDEQATVANLENEMTMRHKIAQKLKKQSDELLQERNQKELMLKGIGDGVIVTDIKHRLILYNETALKMLGVSTDVAIGDHIALLFQHTVIDGKKLNKFYRAISFTDFPIKVIHPDTSWINVNCNTFFDEYHEPSGRSLILHDITREKEIDRMKTDFVSSVSHELRTPLTSIKGFTATILREPGMPEKTRTAFLNIINDESDRLTDLIEELLEISRIESGKLSLTRSEFQLVEIIKSIQSKLSLDLEKNNLQLDIDCQPELPPINADRDKMHIILINLISNAIKFTPAGGTITTRIQSDDNTVTVSVEDTGLGIPPASLDRIFDRFYRVHRADSQIQGTGLGLAIVRELVELHGGRITAQSELNKGSIFTVLLPLSNFGQTGKILVDKPVESKELTI